MPDSLDSPAMQKIRAEDRLCRNMNVTQRAREIAAEHLRRDNKRHGRELWNAYEIGEILYGMRDHAPAVQIVADALEIIGEGN